jgi:hypothetical protein
MFVREDVVGRPGRAAGASATNEAGSGGPGEASGAALVGTADVADDEGRAVGSVGTVGSAATVGSTGVGATDPVEPPATGSTETVGAPATGSTGTVGSTDPLEPLGSLGAGPSPWAGVVGDDCVVPSDELSEPSLRVAVTVGGATAESVTDGESLGVAESADAGDTVSAHHALPTRTAALASRTAPRARPPRLRSATTFRVYPRCVRSRNFLTSVATFTGELAKLPHSA